MLERIRPLYNLQHFRGFICDIFWWKAKAAIIDATFRDGKHDEFLLTCMHAHSEKAIEKSYEYFIKQNFK